MNAFHYFSDLESRLESHANKDLATPMAKYMKNHFEYYGIKAPLRKQILMEFKKENGLLEGKEINELVYLCWDHPCREVQYCCMDIVEREKNREQERIELYEWMVLHKSWWDSVDFIAANSFGKIFQEYPQMITEKTPAYMQSNELWLQRTALLFQLKYKTQTNLPLLFNYCEMLADHPDFFIRKAIGWALRQAGRYYPQEVMAFVNNTELSQLSRREALKHL